MQRTVATRPLAGQGRASGCARGRRRGHEGIGEPRSDRARRRAPASPDLTRQGSAGLSSRAMDDDFLDAHVHADGLRDCDLETLARFGVRTVVVCAHDGAIERGEPTAKAWLAQFDRLFDVEATRFRAHGIRALFAVGIHPAHAPWHGLDELLHRLPAYLSQPSAVAVGSLGLKTGSEREVHVLTRQLELARDLRRPVYVSGPPLDPAGGLKSLVSLLLASGIAHDRILVGHVTLAMLPLLRAWPFAIALEPSEGRLPPGDVVAAIRRHGPGRFVLTSHAGEGSADLLAVPQIAARLRAAGLSDDVVCRVARDNALRLLGREDAARSSFK